MVEPTAPISEGTVQEIEPFKTRYRWVMLALACASYFCFGAIMSSIAPLITPILADLNISYSRMGVILVALGIMLAVILFQRRKTA